MTSVDSSSPGRRSFLRFRKPASTGQNSLISSSSRPAETANRSKKKSFAPVGFRGLGCASSTASQAHAPASDAATVRPSEDWQGKRARRRRVKHRPPAAAADLWCSPIIALAPGDDSVDCVVSHRDLIGRRWRRYPERALREMAGNHDQTSSMADAVPSLQTMLFEYDLLPPRRSHHMRGYYRRPSAELDEASMTPLWAGMISSSCQDNSSSAETSLFSSLPRFWGREGFLLYFWLGFIQPNYCN